MVLAVSNAVRPTLIALSHLRWDFVFQRPQHLLTRAATDYDVIVVEEPIWTDAAAPGVEFLDREHGIRVAQPTLPHGTSAADSLDHQRRVLDGLVANIKGSLTVWYYTPMALPFSRHIAADVTVFDKMDELSAFANPPPLLLALEAELLERADVVFTGGAAMHKASVHRHANIHCFPSSIDTAHFGAARDGMPDPADQAAIAHPRIGFFGVIDERMDIALVGEVAALRPDWQIVMIGPTAKIDPAHLPQAANLHWLGGKSYVDLPPYLANWDVGFMPFAINDATKFISPTKTPEFLAAGLPVVSTAIADVIAPYGDLGLVEIASTAADTVAAIERVMARDRGPWLAKVDAQLASGSWDQVWSDMHALMRAVTPSTTNLKETARV
ncbi:glycosyltransferase [Glacieibacterium megasporae]|uniref:glycosyltransferase n=1 Tax=Glacieibacterium megasporae TaxID=2835787 RepID=UPI0021052038|nr:glycosyltransferase [Polymorphobacter megasporae]